MKTMSNEKRWITNTASALYKHIKKLQSQYIEYYRYVKYVSERKHMVKVLSSSEIKEAKFEKQVTRTKNCNGVSALHSSSFCRKQESISINSTSHQGIRSQPTSSKVSVLSNENRNSDTIRENENQDHTEIRPARL